VESLSSLKNPGDVKIHAMEISQILQISILFSFPFVPLCLCSSVPIRYIIT